VTVSAINGYSMKNTGLIIPLEIALLLGLAACQTRPIPPISIYEDQSQFVRLETGHTVGGSHSHPAHVTTDEMVAVLSGVMIEEPTRLMQALPLLSNKEEPPRHPAFSAAEISFLAPLLVKGLESAKPEEIVTFYRLVQEPGTIDHVTSGGVFIDSDKLYFILGNYRSPTRYPPDVETMRYVDGRSTPLQSITPQEAKLDFQPKSAVAPPRQETLKNPFRPKRREIVVLFKNLTSPTSDREHKPR
jgi:hypothetical protein